MHGEAVMADFDDIVAGLELEAPEDAVDYTQLDRLELTRLKARYEVELTELQEVRYPRTDRGHEIHSELTAVYNALKLNGWA